MKPIYNFETAVSPILTERMLQAKLEQKKLQKQTALVTLAGLLLQSLLFLLAAICYPTYPALAWAVIFYCILSISGSGVVTFIFIEKRRDLPTWLP